MAQFTGRKHGKNDDLHFLTILGLDVSNLYFQLSAEFAIMWLNPG